MSRQKQLKAFLVADTVSSSSGKRCMVLQGEKSRLDSMPHREEVFEPQQSSGHLVFLSARPESYKGFTEGLSFKRIFEPLVRRGDLQGRSLMCF